MIFDRLVEIFKKIMPQTDVSHITRDSVLTSDLGVDSMNMLLLAITVEDEFGIRFTSTSGLNTVGDICDYVEANTAKG